MATRGLDFKTAYYRSLFALAAAFVSAIDAPLFNQRHATEGTESRSRNAFLSVNSLTYKSQQGPSAPIAIRFAIRWSLVLFVLTRTYGTNGVNQTARRIKHRERQLRSSCPCSESVSPCGQNRCQSGLSAVRGLGLAPAPLADLFPGKVDRKRGHNRGTFSWAQCSLCTFLIL